MPFRVIRNRFAPGTPLAIERHQLIGQLVGDLPRLVSALRDLRGRFEKPLDVWVTEYGYETNPPDRFRGVSLRRQARYHGLATFLAWHKGDVTSFAQFLMNDIGPPPGAGS